MILQTRLGPEILRGRQHGWPPRDRDYEEPNFFQKNKLMYVEKDRFPVLRFSGLIS